MHLYYCDKSSHVIKIQYGQNLPEQETIDGEFSAFSPIKDASPKYVLSFDSVDMLHNGVVVQSHLFKIGRKDLSSIDYASIEVFSYVWNSNHLLTK